MAKVVKMIKTIIIKKEYKIESGADLTGADLRGVNLTDADLRGANIYGADLTGADFTGAYFRGIKYDSNTKYDEGSNLDLYIKNLESKIDE